MTEPLKTPASTFHNLGIAEKLLAILDKNNFTQPTPIQHQCIPDALQGKDIVGIAQTGTGKTLAFGIPVIQRIAQLKGQALILVPTRELAIQVDEALRKIGSPLGLRTAVVIGGAPMRKQIMNLKSKPHVVIATPGRMIDHMKQGTYSPSEVTIVVLDEADRMFDIGFLPDIKRILEKCPQEKQVLLFSATMPSAIAQIASQHMHLPLRIEVAPAGTAAKNVEQELFIIDKQDKSRLLEKLLTDTAGTVLVFSRTKHGAKKITRLIKTLGHTAAEIHSNRSLAQRTEAMHGFKHGKYRILVATDIAARGIDVQNIELVINFDLPDNSEDYVHRIGRTGRAGLAGRAVSFATREERRDIKQIERLIKKTIPILNLPALPERRFEVRENDHEESVERPRRRFQSQRNPQSGGFRGVRRGGPSFGRNGAGGARRSSGSFRGR